MCDMTHSLKWHDSFICDMIRDKYMNKSRHTTCDIYEWVMSYLRMSHVTHMVTVMSYLWMSHVTHMVTSCQWHDTWHDSFTCVTWLIHVCDMTHSYVWHDSFTRVTWRIHMRDMTHLYVWHGIHMCDMTHTYLQYVWHDSYMCDMTHSYGMHAH